VDVTFDFLICAKDLRRNAQKLPPQFI